MLLALFINQNEHSDARSEHLRRAAILGANERWADAESSMDYSLKNMASAKGGKLDYARRVELGKIPGREFEVSYPDGLKMRGRIFAANLTFYLFSAVTKDKAPSVRSLKFLNSVQLNVKI